MSSSNVLVFGPTGAVGSAAALSASSRGATVWLAMRDPSKRISNIPSTSTSYTRIQADLSDPASLSAAVAKSNAKTAFVYVLHNSPDDMLASFSALKTAGIEYVVLLSSYSVQGDAGTESNHEERIPRLHARAEIALEKTGVKYTALRPAYFNSNMTWFFGSDLATGKVRILYPETGLDWIAPNDIGDAAGVLLANPPAESEIVYMCGPEMLSQRQALSVVGEVLGKTVEVVEVDKEQWFEKMEGFPREALETLAKGLRTGDGGVGIGAYPEQTYEQGIRSFERITGKKPTKLGAWVEDNRECIEALGKA